MEVTVLAVSGLGACGDDEPEATGGDDPPDATGGDLPPADTELGDGLVVPEGARLAGTVFPMAEIPPDTGGPIEAPDGWFALLTLDEGEVDPFAVFDALAADVRAAGPALPGTADSCSWMIPSTDDEGGPDRAVAVAGPAPPAEEIATLACEATAQDGDASFTVRLDWGADHPGTVSVTRAAGGRAFAIGSEGEPYDATPEPPLAEASPECASGGCMNDPTTPEGDPVPTTRQPPDTLPPTGPDPVPAASLDLLPDRAAAEDPAIGDPFGGESGCFSTLRARFHLPAGATLAGTVGGYDATSVLAVDDLDATLAALRAEAAKADPEGVFGEPGDVALDDGTTVRFLGLEGNAGGTCGFRGSPDGHHLLVQMGPD
ncbi:MAG TPA: hypothetical protein VGO60_06155 [Iamia sp.]|jgi:hypothetical protein|nr:hypothetical protein [Iamia sp.]